MVVVHNVFSFWLVNRTTLYHNNGLEIGQISPNFFTPREKCSVGYKDFCFAVLQSIQKCSFLKRGKHRPNNYSQFEPSQKCNISFGNGGQKNEKPVAFFYI